MHLLIEEQPACLRMNKVAVMMADTLLHLEDNREDEERSSLNCVDIPQTSLTDGQSTNLLQCQETAENSSPIKCRRYGYVPFALCWTYVIIVSMA